MLRVRMSPSAKVGVSGAAAAAAAVGEKTTSTTAAATVDETTTTTTVQLGEAVAVVHGHGATADDAAKAAREVVRALRVVASTTKEQSPAALLSAAEALLQKQDVDASASGAVRVLRHAGASVVVVRRDEVASVGAFACSLDGGKTVLRPHTCAADPAEVDRVRRAGGVLEIGRIAALPVGVDVTRALGFFAAKRLQPVVSAEPAVASVSGEVCISLHDKHINFTMTTTTTTTR